MRTPTLFRSYSAAPVSDLKNAPRGEAGSDSAGLWIAQLYGGGPDVNPELSGSAKFEVYDEMRKTDGSVKATLAIPKLAMRSAVWGLNPKDKDDPLALMIRDYVAENLGLEGHEGWVDLSHDEMLQHDMTSLDFGPALAELVYADELRTWYDADGDAHLVRPLVRYSPRHPRTIQEVKREKGEIVRVTQNVPGTQPIPGEKLVHLIPEREGDRWDGVSLLRPMWGPWLLKKNLLISAGIGFDRFAMGFPVVYHPDDPEAEEVAKIIGRNIRTHERGSAHLPSNGVLPNGEPDSEWVIKILNAAATLADPVPLIRLCSESIAEAGLQHAMRQGLGQTGARASAMIQIDPLFLAVEAYAEYFRLQRSRQVIRRLVAINFGPEAAEKLSPILTVSKIQARNVEVTAQAIALLDSAGITFSDREATNDVREMLGFPVLPDDLSEYGIDVAKLNANLQAAGLDSATLATVVNALPPSIGLVRNRVPEGVGLAA